MLTILLQSDGWTITACVGTLVAAVIAAIYTGITANIFRETRKSIEGQRKLAEFEIYTKLAERLECNDADELIVACENSTLIIKENSNAIERLAGKVYASTNYITRVLINPIEDLAKFYKDGLISFQGVDTGFGYTILLVGSNETIRKLLTTTRAKYIQSNTLFEQLYNELYKACDDKEKSKYKQTLF